MFLCFFLLAIFLAAAIHKMVLKTEKKEVPAIDPKTGLCVVCGSKDGHAWPCITFLINMAIKHYRDRLLENRMLLAKLRDNHHISDVEVKEQIERIDYSIMVAKDLG